MQRARKGSTPRAAEPPAWATAAPDDSEFQAFQSRRLHRSAGRVASPRLHHVALQNVAATVFDRAVVTQGHSAPGRLCDGPTGRIGCMGIGRGVQVAVAPQSSSDSSPARAAAPNAAPTSRRGKWLMAKTLFEPAARSGVTAADPDASSPLGTCHSASPLGIIGESVAITARLRREKHDLRHATDVDAILHAISIRRDSVENERHHRASRQHQDST